MLIARISTHSATNSVTKLMDFLLGQEEYGLVVGVKVRFEGHWLG